MMKEYDFSKAGKNPCSKVLKQQITIRIERETIDYFKKLAVENGVSYQNLIDLYLSDCVHKKKKLTLHWG